MFDAHHGFHAAKKHVAVQATHPYYARGIGKWCKGARHDYADLQTCWELYKPLLRKSPEELQRHPNPPTWAALFDSGYIGPEPSGLNKIAIPRESHADPVIAALKKKRVVVEQFFGRMTVLWTSLLIPYRFALDTLDTDVDVRILLINENIKLNNMNDEDLKNHQKYLGLLAQNAAKATAKAEKKCEKAKATAAKRARFSKNGPDETH
ncbi:hypothetical protein Pelo_6456 [Pelomyxa schiedti]|nr:hypothetical protein Pelo_6456 [Pelomyxa schiedti]